MTAPSADRAPKRGNWFTRLPWPGKAKPRSQPPAQVDYGYWTVDRAIRVLTTSCARERRPVPPAHAVVVGTDTVAFQLGTPDERPPAEWKATNDGRTWQAQLRWLQSANVAERLPDPYPRLVSLGTGSEGFILLNLSQAGGVIGLEGDAGEALALAEDWARDLTTSPWSRDVKVVRVGFRDAPAGPDATTDVATFRDTEAVLRDEPGGVLILAGMPGGRDKERLHALAEDPTGRWSVVVVGRVDNPRWRFSADGAGLVDTGLFSGPVAHRPNAAGSVAVASPAAPTGKPADTPKARPLYARPLFITATVAFALLLGTGLTLALVDFSSSADSAADQPTPQAPAPSPPPNAPQPVAAPPESAPPPPPPAGPGRQQLVNPATGNCLTASAATERTPLTLQPCTDAPTQKWAVTEKGTIRMQGLCIDAAGGGTTPGTVVQIANCKGNPTQQFSHRDDTLHSQKANLCATAVDRGAGIRLQACDKNEAQIFKHG